MYTPDIPGAVIWHETQTDRIRSAYVANGVRETKSFPVDNDSNKAILLCLKWQWKMHCECIGATCPFSELLPASSG
eukprot:11207585-Lingulodinium_polyedra.AAC.1